MARWDGIYEFVKVVEAGSFTAAADAMGMANSQVSKLIARLEARLGIRLLNRTTRSLTLTDEGEDFYARCKRTIDEFETAEQDIASHHNEARGSLKVNMAGAFQERFMVPILAQFLMQHPKLTVDVDFTDQRIDLVSHAYDLSICEGKLEDSSLVARRLADNWHYLVAHPDYLKHRGNPRSLEELATHNCLIGADAIWPLSNGEQTVRFRPTGNWRSPNAAAILSAARSGLGIAMLPFFSVLEDIAAGQLVHILQPWSLAPRPVWAVYPRNRHLSAKVRLFIDYLVDHLNEIEL